MATTPTQNAVPSESPRDLKFNAGKIDEFVTSGQRYYIDRFGRSHRTIAGIDYDANQAIKNYGYILKDSFEDSATLNTANEVLRWESNGEYYRWDGSFPKVVPAGSTPAGTGGVGVGAWVGVGDASLRETLNSPDGVEEVYIGDKPISFYLPLLTSRWGIDETKDKVANANRLNQMIDYAISTGRLIIDVDTFPVVDDINVPIRKKTEVFFRSKGGEIRGLYRRATLKPGAPSNVRVDNGLCQAGMAQFYRAENPRVVIMGDSISTDGPNALAKNDSMSALIRNSIIKQNPGRGINFVNLAIGGQTWLNANAKPTAFPAWYQDTSKNWLDYVRDSSPDLLILAFGMNDANGFNAGAMHAVVDKIKAWDKVPSLIFVTNPVPAMATTYNSGSGFYATVFQEGRDWAAGYARTYAKFNAHSILDINRQFCLMRDGRDYLCAPLERRAVYNQAYLNGITSGAVRDFSISGDISAWPVNKVLSVKVGSGELDIVYITNEAGNFKITAFCTGQQSLAYKTQSTTVPVTLGQTLEISVQGDQFTLFSGITQVITFPLIRTGGEFAVVAEFQGSPNTGPFSSITINAGNWLQCEYTARDSDIWGHDDGTADTKLPEGGNGINHYSSKGLALVVSPVVDAFDWRQKVIESKRTIQVLNTGVTSQGVISAIRTGNQIALTGRLVTSVSTRPYKLFDLPAGFKPSAQRVLSTSGLSNTTSTYGVVVLSVQEDGGVLIASGDATGYLTLDGVTFEV